jgi:hypothetical protein
MTITQTSISTCEHEAFGPVTLCRFTRGTKAKPTHSYSLVTTAAFAKARRRPNSVDVISALQSVLAFTPSGLAAMKEYGPVLLQYSSHFNDLRPEGDMLFSLESDADADALAAFLGSLSPKALLSHVYLFFSDVLFPIDADKESRPVNFPVHVDISSSDVDIDKAEVFLGKRKCVRAIHRSRALTGPGYVPASLDVIVALSAPMREAIEGLAATNKSQYRFRPNEPVGAGRLEMTYLLVPAPGRPAKFNALGLNALARKVTLDDSDGDEEDYDHY